MNGLNLSVNTISNIVEGTLLFDNQNNFKINNDTNPEYEFSA